MIAEAKVSKSFGRFAGSYDTAASMQREVASRLAERLDYFQLKVDRALDLGSGTGFCAQHIMANYPSATCVCLDLSLPMLAHASGKGLGQHHVCASASSLPLADNSFDMVISSMMLHWCEHLDPVIRETQRVLRPGGLFVFSACASGTLQELNEALQEAGMQQPSNIFPSMHDLAAAVSAAYSEPVLDRETMQLLRPGLKGLVSSLRRSGALPQTGKPPGRDKLKKLKQAYEKHRRDDGQLPMSFEIVYGHGFAPTSRPSEAVVSLSRLRR